MNQLTVPDVVKDILANRSVSMVSVIETLYVLLLERLMNCKPAKASETEYVLLAYALNMCVDPSREEQHHHPVFNTIIHATLCNRVKRKTTVMDMRIMMMILIWLQRGCTTTPLEFYAVVPALFLIDVIQIRPILEKNASDVELSNFVQYVLSLVPTEMHEVDDTEISRDKRKWIKQYENLALLLDQKLAVTEDTKAWDAYALNALRVVSYGMVISVIARKSSNQFGCQLMESVKIAIEQFTGIFVRKDGAM